MNSEDIYGLVRFVVANLRRAGHLKAYAYDDEDIRQVGALAAVEALGHYDGTRETTISTYVVPRIRGAILDYAATERNGGMASKRKALCLVSLDAEIALDESAATGDYAISEYETALTGTDAISYEDSIFEHVPGEFRDAEGRIYEAQLSHAVTCLPEPYRTSVERAFGLNGVPQMGFAEIEREYGIASSTAQKRLTAALSRLRLHRFVRY